MKVLMVSGEYPPMKGGVGRYTHNLVTALEKNGVDIAVACSVNNAGAHGSGLFPVIRKGDRQNSSRLLDLVDELKPDVVDVQYERGLYEIDTTPKHILQRLMYGSTLTKFFENCPVPTISTLHTVIPHEEYRSYVAERARRKEGRFAALPTPVRYAIRRWFMEQRYNLLVETVAKSTEVISPSHTLLEIVKRGRVIYHGAEIFPGISKPKDELRQEFGLPAGRKLLLAFGYVGSYKGFDILDSMKLPAGWDLVVKQNKHERGVEKPVELKNAISLNLGYIDDAALSRLFLSCDAIIFPYRVVSISGVMFDALAHGLPFVASDLRFFKEFERMGLGITARRDPQSFSEALGALDAQLPAYREAVAKFSGRLSWDRIAKEHADLYRELVYASRPKLGVAPAQAE